MNNSTTIISAVLLATVSQFSVADATITHDNPHFGDKGWEVSVGIGVLSATDSIYQRDDDDYEKGIYIPLDLTWYGENFHFTADEKEGLLLGYTLARNNNWALDGILSPRGAGPFDNDLLEDLDDRDIDFHAGVRYTQYGEDNVIKLEASKDISNTHDGFILSASYEQEWQIKNWIVSGGVGIGYVSEDMIDYYFGVNNSEATADFPQYDADETTIASISARAEYPVNENWVFNTQLTHAFLGDEITDSSITTNDDGLTVFTTAMVYQF